MSKVKVEFPTKYKKMHTGRNIKEKIENNKSKSEKQNSKVNTLVV